MRILSRDGLRLSAFILMGHIATILIGIGSLRLITELASLRVFGEGNILLSMLALGSQVFLAPISNTVLRFHTQRRQSGDAQRYSMEAIKWSLRLSVLLIPVYFVALAAYTSLSNNELSILAYLGGAIYIILVGPYNILTSQIHAEARQEVFTLINVINAAVVAVFTGVGLYFVPSSGGFVIGQSMAVAVSLFVVMAFRGGAVAERRQMETPGVSFSADLYSYGAPFIIIAMLNWLANMADRFVLAAFLNSSAVGQYVAAFAIASRGMALVNALCSDLFRAPLFNAVNQNEHATAYAVFRNWLVAIVVLTLCAMGFLWIAGPFLTSILLAQEYREGAIELMLWIATAYGICGINQALEIRILSLVGSKRLVAPMAIGALGNVALACVFVPWNGVVGAAQATCASFAQQFLVTVLVLLQAHRRVQQLAGQSGIRAKIGVADTR